MLFRLFVCFCIGAGFGLFTSTEWAKWHKKETCEWKTVEPTGRIITKDDIRVLNWAGKK